MSRLLTIKILPFLSGLSQMGCISPEERNRITKMLANEDSTDYIYDCVYPIYAQTKNPNAREILKVLENTKGEN